MHAVRFGGPGGDLTSTGRAAPPQVVPPARRWVMMTMMTTDGTDPAAVTTAQMAEPATVTAAGWSASGTDPIGAGSEQRLARPRRRGASARLQIMGWLV
ncbi:MAG: hypothetical protein ACRDXB_18140, partial [Actinomycetes bacterium]